MPCRKPPQGTGFDEALAEAQRLGYAERDPSADVKGIDTCRKIVILAALAGGRLFNPSLVLTKGIEGITEDDVNAAECLGGTIRLIGKYEKMDEKALLMVSPFVVPAENPLYGVQDVYNAISVRGDAVGDVMFYGRGAGNLPTASAVVADIIDALLHKHEPILPFVKASAAELVDPELVPMRFCIFCANTAPDGISPVLRGLSDGMYAACGDGVCFKSVPIAYAELREKLQSVPAYSAIPILE